MQKPNKIDDDFHPRSHDDNTVRYDFKRKCQFRNDREARVPAQHLRAEANVAPCFLCQAYEPYIAVLIHDKDALPSKVRIIKDTEIPFNRIITIRVGLR